MARIQSDEPTHVLDHLDHFKLAKEVGKMMLSCDPPHVVGVCGTWGSGKTSFLKKLWVYMGGWFGKETEQKQRELRREYFGTNYVEPSSDKESDYEYHLVWFNPWHHQFEQNPLVALLFEIRQQLGLTRKVLEGASKAGTVAAFAILDMLDAIGQMFQVPLPGQVAANVQNRVRQYNDEHFSSPLPSQRFREFFEKAIEFTTERRRKKARLVIFIDDLDRCEGDVAFRLLESLKLYLNAGNCIYVLGMDQEHLEETIARVLSGDEDTHAFRPLARSYLNKMFQSLFLLPVPKTVEKFVDETLHLTFDNQFQDILANRFNLVRQEDWFKITEALNENLPHNPRRIKSFVAAWKLYVRMLDGQHPPAVKLDWRLTVILNYLGQFEEPLFRKVEEAPGFYNDFIALFCREGNNQAHPLLNNLELPYGMASPYSSEAPEGGKDKRYIKPRIFWIARLIQKLNQDLALVDADMIRAHLLHTGKPLIQPPQQVPQNDDVQPKP